ncbi:hypothetical protein SAMN05443579_1168 [Variovorax sp. PDC80]|jgi:hypothetical protein|uniref:hypothetical protein n=1 Tax=Variovorax TaxID=34072 RepID=UPI0008E60946|nr:hypothetical protein [Variovorax sp. PDC80]SFP82772.1 hypothetical protein SAMN05443579_1168 [Variovorax sp. PDC80]
MKRALEVERTLQPVVELKEQGAAYGYSVRAPRSKGVIPPSSYRDSGFATLPDCLRDVAKALGGDFKRIYIRLEGHCVGERDIVELRDAPDAVAEALKAACLEADAAVKPVGDAGGQG